MVRNKIIFQGKEDTAKVDVIQREKAKREQTEKMVYEQFLMGVNNVGHFIYTLIKCNHTYNRKVYNYMLSLDKKFNLLDF